MVAITTILIIYFKIIKNQLTQRNLNQLIFGLIKNISESEENSMSSYLQYIGEFDNYSGFFTVCDPVVNRVINREANIRTEEETSCAIRNCKPGHYVAYYELDKKANVSAVLLHHDSLTVSEIIVRDGSFEHVATISTTFSHILCIVENSQRDFSNRSAYDIEDEAIYDAKSLKDVIQYSRYEKDIKVNLINYLDDCIENGNGNAYGEDLIELTADSKIPTWSGFRNNSVPSNHWGIDIKNHVLNSYSPGYLFVGGIATKNTLLDTNVSALYDLDGTAVCLRIPVSDEFCGLEANFSPQYDRDGRPIEQPDEEETDMRESCEERDNEVLPVAVGQGASSITSFSDILKSKGL